MNSVDVINTIRSGTKISNYIVNIGASNGFEGDILYSLFCNGFDGIAIECRKQQFEDLKRFLPQNNITKVNAFVTTNNILDILHDTPNDVDWIDIDIDSLDYQIAKAVLSKYQPKIFTVEINEIIPPKIEFYLYDNIDLYQPGFSDGDKQIFALGNDTTSIDRFYGASLSSFVKLFNEYKMIALNFNNAYFVRNDLIHLFGETKSPTYHYDVGYINRPGKLDGYDIRKANKEYDYLYALPADQVISILNKQYEKYSGSYYLGVSNIA